ncbi:MAG: MoxR family ATPase [Clostridia bacterium]|nr:MoxR family ATPase [Clostridia bacterium]
MANAQEHVAQLAKKVSESISKVIVGKESTLELMLCALIAKGHVLLEDVPGTGKTMTAKALAKSLSCSYTRIQFTPDLLPGDVTGISVYNAQEGRFVFNPGPVFTNILLADEINRATPRTQSSLLECMEERQVTIDGQTRKLEEPFLVIATQNPIETQGTFPLPEAQLDRFLMRLKPGYPDTQESIAILSRFVTDDPLSKLEPVAGAQDIIEAQKAFMDAYVSPAVMGYIVAICERTRSLAQVQLGASPRAMLALMRASQALAMIRGRSFVTPDDVKALAKPVLAHRMIVRGMYSKEGLQEQAVEEALSGVSAPTEADAEA